MKKIKLFTLILLTSITAIQANTMDHSKNVKTEITNTKEVPPEIKIMIDRLEEIKSMDKSSLNSKEKKELRKEVRSIKSSLSKSGNGVYLSVGAIIIIILLLILLL